MKHKQYLDSLPLVEALWWFIENVNVDDPDRSDYFFYLRERYRNETSTPTPKIRKTCYRCNGDEVRIDAWASWNVETQEWELAETYQQEFCNSCEGETHINDEEIVS